MNTVHWMGKLIGAAVGLAKGGFAGLLFGLFLGHLFDRWRSGASHARSVQQAFFDNLFATLGHLAKADGHVSRAEIDQAEFLMRRMNLRQEDRRRAIEQFNRGKRPDYDFTTEIRKFSRLTLLRPDLRQMFFEILLEAAAADGKLAHAELVILQVVIRELRLPPQLLDEILAWFRSGRPGAGPGYRQQTGASTPSADDDYAVLGLARNASDAEVKRAYRKLMSKYHPDKLIHQGLPESALEMAREKARNINAAYDRIKTRRGFK